MAKGTSNKNENVEVPKKKQYKGTAKQYIKYGGKHLAIGEEFDIAKKDVEELSQYADVEEIEVEVTPENDGDEKGEGQKEGE